MKNLNDIINEAAPKGEWCLWDYEDGEREVLIWKGDGKDQSFLEDVGLEGTDLLNVPFEDIVEYCNKHKSDPIDKWHFDFSNAKIEKLKNVF